MKGKKYSWKKEYFLTQVLKLYKFWVVNLQTILSCKSSYKKILQLREQNFLMHNRVALPMKQHFKVLKNLVALSVKKSIIIHCWIFPDKKHWTSSWISAIFDYGHLAKELPQQPCCARRLTHTFHKLFQGCKSSGTSSEAAASVRVKATFALGTKVSAKAGVAVFYSAS